MEIFLFPSSLSPLGERITVSFRAVIPFDTKIEHVRREYEGSRTVITSYFPSLVEPLRVGVTTRLTTAVPQGRCVSELGSTIRQRTAILTKSNMYKANTKAPEQYLPVTFRVWSNRSVSERLRSRKRRYRRVSERRNNESATNGKTKHVRCEYRLIGTVITSYVRSLVEPWRVGEAYAVQYGNSLDNTYYNDGRKPQIKW